MTVLEDLEALSSFMVGVSVIVGAAMWAVRANLRGAFVTPRAFAELEARMDAVEERLARMPGHDDLRAIHSRLGEMERSVAASAATIGGMRDAVGRVEHMVDLLLSSQLEKKL